MLEVCDIIEGKIGGCSDGFEIVFVLIKRIF